MAAAALHSKTDDEEYAELVTFVLKQLGSNCDRFLAGINSHLSDNSYLSQTSFRLIQDDSASSNLPTRRQLKAAVDKIVENLDWEYFAARIQKINQRFPHFRIGDDILSVKFDIARKRFVEMKKKKRAEFTKMISEIEGVKIEIQNEVDFDIIPESFVYIKNNTYHDSIALPPVIGCKCRKMCGPTSVRCCPPKNGCKWAYSKTGPFLADVNNDKAIYECNSMCNCSMECPNRVAQKGIQIPLRIIKTKQKGFGVMALVPIQAGAFVMEFTGHVIPKSVFYAKYGAGSNGMSNTFALDFNEEKHAEYFIDAQETGNVSRFLNSRCVDANLEIKAVFVDYVDAYLPRIAFYAQRDIAIYEELTIDYYEGLKADKLSCNCDSPYCRERTPGTDELYSFSTESVHPKKSRSQGNVTIHYANRTKTSALPHKVPSAKVPPLIITIPSQSSQTSVKEVIVVSDSNSGSLK